jgi:hypothetical protein
MTKKEEVAVEQPKEPEVKTKLDGFDMAEFVTTGSMPMVKKRILDVPVKRPNKQKFFKVVPGKEWETTVWVVEIKEDNEFYIVKANMVPYIQQEVKLVRLNLAYYLDGNVFFIPIPLPDPENPGKWNTWHRSMDKAVKAAETSWIRTIPEKSIGGYNIMEAEGTYKEPKLPTDMVLVDYLKIAFDKGRIIEDTDHPILRQLLGQGTLG